MLRASKMVRASPTGLPAPLRMLVGQHRLVSTQLVRNPVSKKKTAASKKSGLWRSRKPSSGSSEESKHKWLTMRETKKAGKLAAKLAELKSKNKKRSADPVTPEQRQLLDLIQGPVVSANDLKIVHRNFLTNALRRTYNHEPSVGASTAERAWEDPVSGHTVFNSQLESLETLPDEQKSDNPAGESIPHVFNDRGNTLHSQVTSYFKQRSAARRGTPSLPVLQQLNMPVRFASHREDLFKILEAEAQFQIEQEKIYQARLESIKSRAEVHLSKEDLARYKSLQQSHADSQNQVTEVLTHMGHVLVHDNFNKTVKPALIKQLLSHGSDSVHILNTKFPQSPPIRMKLDKFLSRQKDGVALPQAAVSDGKRVYAKYNENIVVFPFYRLDGVRLTELLKNVVFAEFERIRREYSVAEDELVAQLGILADRKENYLRTYPPKPAVEVDEVTGLPVDDPLEFTFFKINETEKEKYFKTRSAFRASMGLPEVLPESVLESGVKTSSYADVVVELEKLKPLSVLVNRKQWDAIAESIDKNVLVDDLRQYVRDKLQEKAVPLPKTRLVKAELVELLRQAWGITLSDSFESHRVCKRYKLSAIQKEVLFKHHFQLVELWVTRGADVSLENDELVVSAHERAAKIVDVTLSQFSARITSGKLDMSKQELKRMTPALWKSVGEATETHIVHSDDGIVVYYLGNVHKKIALIKRYVQLMQPSAGFSQSILYQTNPESVAKSAFFPRSVSHEQPWHQRVVQKWARWREIHGADYMVNLEQPQLSLVSSAGVSSVPSDQPLQNVISDTLMTQLEALPSTVVTQDPAEVVESADERGLKPEVAEKAARAGVVAPFDPSANNMAPTVYEKVSISATLGHLVHANKTTRGSRGSLDVASIDPLQDVHFSGSIPYLNEKLRSMFPKARSVEDRYKAVMHFAPVSGDAPPVEVEAVHMDKEEKQFQYPPPSLYAVTRHANVAVSLPSTNADMLFSARSRQKLLPSQAFLDTWANFWGKASRQVQYPPDFELNVNGENTQYRCSHVVYTRQDEYPPLNTDLQESPVGVVLHRHTAGGDMCGVRNEVILGTVWRDYKIEAAEEQAKSDLLLDDFVGNSLKFMDSLDAESLPL
ncbi:hypothetical protein CJU89_2669 [Yarrowia sp. B02]|nr:hypothetical protein CJU89_2669 [Yarrowia sp. B02]